MQVLFTVDTIVLSVAFMIVSKEMSMLKWQWQISLLINPVIRWESANLATPPPSVNTVPFGRVGTAAASIPDVHPHHHIPLPQSAVSRRSGPVHCAANRCSKRNVSWPVRSLSTTNCCVCNKFVVCWIALCTPTKFGLTPRGVTVGPWNRMATLR